MIEEIVPVCEICRASWGHKDFCVNKLYKAPRKPRTTSVAENTISEPGKFLKDCFDESDGEFVK